MEKGVLTVLCLCEEEHRHSNGGSLAEVTAAVWYFIPSVLRERGRHASLRSMYICAFE